MGRRVVLGRLGWLVCVLTGWRAAGGELGLGRGVLCVPLPAPTAYVDADLRDTGKVLAVAARPGRSRAQPGGSWLLQSSP
jgi:hypothetical protein